MHLLLSLDPHFLQSYDRVMDELWDYQKIPALFTTLSSLFYQAKKEDNKSFIVRGSHNTVTACSPPIWISEHIVDSMNEAFGGQLRQELIDFMDCLKNSTFVHNHTHSTGSQKLSIGSIQDLVVHSLPIAEPRFRAEEFLASDPSLEGDVL